MGWERGLKVKVPVGVVCMGLVEWGVEVEEEGAECWVDGDDEEIGVVLWRDADLWEDEGVDFGLVVSVVVVE